MVAEMEVEEKAGKPQSEALLLNYTDKLHEMDLLDGYNIHHKTEEVLQGLGFSNAHLQRPYRGIQRWLADARIIGKNDSSETGPAPVG
ncbi:MAG: hypothetical protein WDM78_24130 [Puia sp.]